MMAGEKTAHRSADGVLLGAAVCLILGLAPLIGINLYTERLTAPPIPAAKPVQPVVGSPVELAGARLAAEGECLAEALYYEARGEGLAGQKAVAEVVLRRTHDVNYAHTVCGVVHEGVREGQLGCQFSYACDGSMLRAREGETWEQARLLAERIMSGAVRLSDTTGQAIAYHATSVSPPWKEKMQKTAQIGNHIFYKFIYRDQVAQVGAGGVKQTSATTAPSSQHVEPKI